MTLSTLTLAAHLVGLALGAGGASTLDIILLVAVRSRRVSDDLIRLLHAASCVVIGAMPLLLVSGLAFLAEGTVPTPKFWAKMVVVAIACANGAVVHRWVFPRVEAAARRGDGGLRLGTRDARLAASAAAVSAVSWYGALMLGTLRGPTLPFVDLVALYLGVLVAAVGVASMVVAPCIFGPPVGEHEQPA